MSPNRTNLADGGPQRPATGAATPGGLFTPAAAAPPPSATAGDPAPPSVLPGLRPCDKCGTPMTFVRNVDSGKLGPVDLSRGATVYVIFTAAVDEGARELPAMTAAEFLKRAERIVMRDGSTVDPATLALQISHFATCPAAGFFSKKGGR